MLLALFLSCSEGTKEESNNDAPREYDVSKLTYRGVTSLVFNDDGRRIEWHGEEMANDMLENLTIFEGDSCGENNCGRELQLASKATDSLVVIIKADYDLKGDQGYISRQYEIAGGDTISIGCSHLCYGPETYKFPRKIVGSSLKSQPNN